MSTIYKQIPCPIWGDREQVFEQNPNTLPEHKSYSRLIYSPRAGGVFQIGGPNHRHDFTKDYLKTLSPRDKAILSYRIFRHNRDLGLLRPRDTGKCRRDVGLETLEQWGVNEQFLQLTEDTIAKGLLDQPPAEERLLSFMQELVWQIDRAVQAPDIARREQEEYLQYLWAATACAHTSEMVEFWDLAQDEAWVQENPSASDLARSPRSAKLTLKARLWVEEQEREQGIGHQGFVAMWFDDHVKEVYNKHICPAIRAAGYKPHRVDDNPDHSDNLVDRILSAIRQSRFVVADFTSGSIKDDEGNTVPLDRGGVYYEAGFAYGLGKPVIYTCKEELVGNLHFDIRQLNHLLWKDEDELARKLTARIERQFGKGPVAMPAKQNGSTEA